MDNTKRHIFFVGPSGVGKTTVGKAFSELASMSFVDVDEKIEELTGSSISDYFANNGESAFRLKEREVLAQLCEASQPHVIVPGAGAILDSRNIVAMKDSGYIIYLSALEEDIVERLLNDESKHRPLLEGDVKQKVHEQAIIRTKCYELSADIVLATSKRSIESISQSALRQFRRISGQEIDTISSVAVGDNILSLLGDLVSGYNSAVIITQESIPQKYRDEIIRSINDKAIPVFLITVPDGESAKSFKCYEDVLNQMSSSTVTRNSVVVALGGGVVGDLSGFVASSYHRGIDIIQVPTTLLAQVDSSLGGKCGINLETGKNLVGAFHQPKVIVADITTLETLSDEDFISGLGEVVKYGLLGNSLVVQSIQDNASGILSRDPQVLIPVIQSCMNQKLQTVSLDPIEKNGIRARLNLGHTLAHAIETQTQFSLPHGYAVALGLRFIAQLSFVLGMIPQFQKDQAISLIDALGLCSVMPDECNDASSLVEHMYKDKKSTGSLSMILMTVDGAELVHDVDPEVVKATLTTWMESL